MCSTTTAVTGANPAHSTDRMLPGPNCRAPALTRNPVIRFNSAKTAEIAKVNTASPM